MRLLAAIAAASLTLGLAACDDEEAAVEIETQEEEVVVEPAPPAEDPQEAQPLDPVEEDVEEDAGAGSGTVPLQAVEPQEADAPQDENPVAPVEPEENRAPLAPVDGDDLESDLEQD